MRRAGKKLLIGKIVEVEAYCEHDSASHSFHGRTHRNEVMFWEGGHLYVYFTYGMHFCANVVTRKEGIGEAVLIRAVEPLVGIDIMNANRFSNLQSLSNKSIINLTNGPAKFCQAFGIARKENGIDLLGTTIFIIDPDAVDNSKLSNPNSSILKSSLGRSCRIGIRNAMKKQWRFFVMGNRWVSK